jgi:hypothetical protein
MEIIHGDDQIKSRSFFLNLKLNLKKNQANLIELDGQKITFTEFISATTTNSLFPEKNIICIEQLFSRRPGKDKQLLLSYLKSHPELPVYIWEVKDVSDQLTGFPATTVRRFDLPKYAFNFLDSLSPDHLKLALDNLPPELLFAQLIRQFHNLILVKSGRGKLPSWQSNKLQVLAKKFSAPRLLQAYRKLLEIDFRQKNSLSVSELSASLQIWLTELHLPPKSV